MKKIRKKLRSSGGMTLTELLVALAIVALIGMTLTVGINGAAKVYRDATRLYEAETLCGTILTYLEDEFRFGRNVDNVSVAGSTEVIFDSQTFGNDVKVILENEADAEKYGKVKIVDSTDSTIKFDLISPSAYTSRLVVNKCEISYDKDTGLVTVAVAVGPDKDTVYASHEVTVAPADL